LLDALYRLGSAQDDRTSHGSISSLITTVNAKYIVGIIFQSKNGRIRYRTSELFEFQNPLWYLFKRDFSGRPGLFLTGNISGQDINKIKGKDFNYSEVQKFIKDKILWFSRGKLVNDKPLFNTLTEEKRNELLDIFREFELKGQKIANDVLALLTKDRPERTLLTIMFMSTNSKNAKPTFVGQIKEYREIFKRASLSKRFTISNDLNDKITCTTCNTKKTIETFIEKPLPFFIADKPMFFPDADPTQSRKGFPLCDECYLQLQKAIQFISENLDYRIPALGSARSELNFWLIPHLNDQQLVINFKKDLRNKNLYLNSLRDLCMTIRSISKHDSHRRANLQSFLRFSALFYAFDAHAIMRVSNYIQGIYPAQLERLLEVKDVLDQRYPFPIISEKLGQSLLFGFPILVMFYKELMPQWQNQLITVLERMLTGQKISLKEVIQNINTKIRESTLKSLDLVGLSRVTFLGLVLLEYIMEFDSYEKDKSNSNLEYQQQLSKDGQNQLQHKQDHENNQNTSKDTAVTKTIDLIQRFIEEHRRLLTDDISRATFAVGICVGILLEVQELRYKKTAPFWNRLNRLDLDFRRIIELFPEVKNKLAIYNERSYDTIINYLAAYEISKINTVSTMSDMVPISKEMLNLIFSVGLSVGSMLKRGYLR
jgi:CRISPR-associated protein Cas8b/Csh1 subtype I-B